ncbi:hypothetical protein D3C72_2139960 [compost metagenome]
MAQPAPEQLREQAAQRPLAVVLEAGNQRIDRKPVMPGRLDPIEGRRAPAALAADQAMHGQRQGTHLAAIIQPGQFAFAGDAQGVGLLGRFIAE